MVCAQWWVRWRGDANRGDAVLGAEGKKGKERERLEANKEETRDEDGVAQKTRGVGMMEGCGR